MLGASVPFTKVPEEATKFILVRHPLPRLVSAYVNKFLEPEWKPFLGSIQPFLRKERQSQEVCHAEQQTQG